MNNRHILDFLRAVDDMRNLTGMGEGACIAAVAEMLGVPMPDAETFKRMRQHRARVTRARSRGRPPAEQQAKGEAVAIVATYFESIGARPEQAIQAAGQWLNVSVSRKVAKAAIDRYRGRRHKSENGTVTHFPGMADPAQYRENAVFVYAQTSPIARARDLPTKMDPAPYKRRKTG